MINSVRNTVLSVLNKNNYGYISPSDFNLYAKQAQMEMFEEYFSNYNKLINGQNARAVGSDYADLLKANEEVLEGFLEYKYLWQVIAPSGSFTSKFFTPSITTTGSNSYMISRIDYYNKQKLVGTNTSVAPFRLISNGSLFTEEIEVGDIVLNVNNHLSAVVVQINSDIDMVISDDIFTDTPLIYAIYSSNDKSEAERVTDGRILSLNMSSLTAPSKIFPAYTINGTELITHPPIDGNVLYGSVAASYFRFPKDPKWTYISLSSGEPSFDQSQPDYQDFELPLEDEYKLAMKILKYCGISIRETQVAQFAIAQEQQPQ